MSVGGQEKQLVRRRGTPDRWQSRRARWRWGPGLCPSRDLRVCCVPIRCACPWLWAPTGKWEVGAEHTGQQLTPHVLLQAAERAGCCHRGRPRSGIRQPAITAAHPRVTNQQRHLPPASKHSGQLHHWSHLENVTLSALTVRQEGSRFSARTAVHSTPTYS